MPISSDGTITPLSPVPGEPRYVSRVVLEFTYSSFDPAYAQETHDHIMSSVVYGANTIDEMLALDGGAPEVRITNAKNPQPVLPEGEGAETGGSSDVG